MVYNWKISEAPSTPLAASRSSKNAPLHARALVLECTRWSIPRIVFLLEKPTRGVSHMIFLVHHRLRASRLTLNPVIWFSPRDNVAYSSRWMNLIICVSGNYISFSFKYGLFQYTTRLYRRRGRRARVKAIENAREKIKWKEINK